MLNNNSYSNPYSSPHLGFLRTMRARVNHKRLAETPTSAVGLSANVGVNLVFTLPRGLVQCH